MDDHHYTVEDFATDDRFVSWVLNDDQEAGAFWRQYLQEHPGARPVAERARILLLNLVRTQKKLNRARQVDRLWAGIDARTHESGPVPPPAQDPVSAYMGGPVTGNGRARRHNAMVAVSLIALSAVAGVLWLQRPVTGRPPAAVFQAPVAGGFIERHNETGRRDTVDLSDGTRVILEDRSRLSYKHSYPGDSAREVFLEGEAYFAVAKNPSQPFFVHANEVVTRVLGTSFRVKAYAADRNILVSVTEGKVSVYSTLAADQKTAARQDINGVVLTSNQQVLYTRNDNAFSRSLVEAPAPVHALPRADVFSYQNANMSEVFGTLQDAYEVEILFPKETMENCYLSVTLKDEPLFEKLSIICKTIGATYELIDGKIVIDSKGCR